MLPIAAGLVAGLTSSAMSYSANERANEVARENMALSNRYALANLRDSPIASAEGFKRAGFHPSTALGQFTNASAPSPATAQKMDIPNIPLLEGLQAQANIKLANAQEQNLKQTNESIKQDVIGKQIENSNKLEKNKASNTLFANSINEVIRNRSKQGLDVGFYENLRDALSENANSGTLDALLQSSTSFKASSENLKYNVENALDELVGNQKISNKAYEDLAEGPRLQRKMLERQLTLSLKQINYVGEQINLAKSNTKLTNQQISNAKQQFYNLLEEQNKLKAEYEQLEKQGKLTEEQTKMLRDTNFIGMIRSGDYGAATASGAWTLLANLIKLL